MAKCNECDDGQFRLRKHWGTGELHKVRCQCYYDLPLKFVYQEQPSGCFAATVAMLLGKSYFEVVRQYYNMSHDFTKQGSYLRQALEILDKHGGFSYQTRYKHYMPLSSQREDWPESWADIILCEVRNMRDSGLHAVILLADGKVLDPHIGVIENVSLYPSVESMTAIYPLAKTENKPDLVIPAV
jgi:hypothetical protein